MNVQLIFGSNRCTLIFVTNRRIAEVIKGDQEADLCDERDHEVDLAANIGDIPEAEIIVEDLEADLETESANVPEADRGTDRRPVIDIIIDDHMNVKNHAADHLRMEEI